jgi:hypothetical protein
MKQFDWEFRIIFFGTLCICYVLAGMNHYLKTHTMNPFEAASQGITLVEPSDPDTALVWHKKYDKIIKSLTLKVYTPDGKEIQH